jgi:REP element-mobilizing transposase RayT
MCRGNGGEPIFWGDADRELFLKTLDEACVRCGWRIHAYVLMGNHYHLLLETPEANLVAGMKWFQGTYTQRFNSRNKHWGHLFQGRYKALNIDGDSGAYFSTVADYIHLNPARAKLFDPGTEGLEVFRWSSYPLYLDPPTRPDWLCVGRVLGDHQWQDSPEGRNRFRMYMDTRVAGISVCGNPAEYDARWKEIRRGWFLGDDAFRKALLERIDDAMAGKQRRSFSGEQVRSHDEDEAERLVIRGLKALGLEDESLHLLKKNCPEKYAVAWLVRRNTCVRNDWIVNRLCMGRGTNFATFLKRMEEGDFGAEAFERVKKN